MIENLLKKHNLITRNSELFKFQIYGGRFEILPKHLFLFKLYLFFNFLKRGVLIIPETFFLDYEVNDITFIGFRFLKS